MRALELAPLATNAFGMSEAYGHTHVTGVDDSIEMRLISCGRPLPGFEVKIVGADGSALPAGEVGELRIKGYISPGYYKDEAQTKAAFDDQGFFKTGDLAWVNDDGYLFFHGRMKEIIRTGGINVSPAEVEAVLLDHPAVHVVHVVGVADPIKEQVLAVVVVPRAGAEITPEAIVAYCRETLTAYKVPRLVCVTTEAALPQTTTGKVYKKQIADKFFAGEKSIIH